MGIIQAGVGLGGIFVAQLARFLIGTFGWREAYVGMGITIFIVAFFPIALFLREPDSVLVALVAPSDAGKNGAAIGPTAGEVLRTSWQFWLLAIAFFLVVVTANGPLIHAVALLTDRGISIQRATAALSAAGLAMIVGRMLAGYCLDRFFGPYVAVVSVAGAMMGLGLSDSAPPGGLVPIAGTVLCGLGMGAEGDIVPYFVSRYFGLRAFGQIYGYLFAVFMVGVGVGPSLFGFLVSTGGTRTRRCFLFSKSRCFSLA